jgi:hypothetical protein
MTMRIHFAIASLLAASFAAAPAAAESFMSKEDIAAAVAAPTSPAPKRFTGGNISGTVIMPGRGATDGVRVIACIAPFDGCSSKYEIDAAPAAGVGFFTVPVAVDENWSERFHVFAWMDTDGNGAVSRGDYVGLAEEGKDVSPIASLGSIDMEQVN